MTNPRDLVEGLKAERAQHRKMRGTLTAEVCFNPMCPSTWPCPHSIALDVAIVLGEAVKESLNLTIGWKHLLKEALAAAEKLWRQEGR